MRTPNRRLPSVRIPKRFCRRKDLLQEEWNVTGIVARDPLRADGWRIRVCSGEVVPGSISDHFLNDPPNPGESEPFSPPRARLRPVARAFVLGLSQDCRSRTGPGASTAPARHSGNWILPRFGGAGSREVWYLAPLVSACSKYIAPVLPGASLGVFWCVDRRRVRIPARGESDRDRLVLAARPRASKTGIRASQFSDISKYCRALKHGPFFWGGGFPGPGQNKSPAGARRSSDFAGARGARRRESVLTDAPAC